MAGGGFVGSGVNVAVIGGYSVRSTVGGIDTGRGVQVSVGVAEAVGDGVGVAVGVCEGIRLGSGVRESVAVAVQVRLGVTVTDGVSLGVTVVVGLDVCVGVGVKEAVPVAVGVHVGVRLGVAVREGVAVGVGVRVITGVSDGVCVGARVGVARGTPTGRLQASIPDSSIPKNSKSRHLHTFISLLYRQANRHTQRLADGIPTQRRSCLCIHTRYTDSSTPATDPGGQKPMDDYLVAFITTESEEQARRIAGTLIERKLAACVNLAPVQSLFMWKGQIEDAAEVLMIVKTRAGVFDTLIETVKALHSYDVPEIIALPVVRGSTDYLQWISEETTDQHESR